MQRGKERKKTKSTKDRCCANEAKWVAKKYNFVVNIFGKLGNWAWVGFHDR